MPSRDRSREGERDVLAAMEALDAANLRGVPPEEAARLQAVIADYMTRRDRRAPETESDDDDDSDRGIDNVICNHMYEVEEHEEDDHDSDEEDLPLLDPDPAQVLLPGTFNIDL